MWFLLFMTLPVPFTLKACVCVSVDYKSVTSLARGLVRHQAVRPSLGLYPKRMQGCFASIIQEQKLHVVRERNARIRGQL